MLAADVVGQLDALAANGWDPADMGDAVASYISWIYRQVDEAVDAGLERWGGLS